MHTRVRLVIIFTVAVSISAGVVADDFQKTNFLKEGLDSTRLVQLGELIESDYFRQIRGVVVLKGGKLLYENYFNNADRETLQDIRSAGKSLTSALVGIAFDRGDLTDLDQPLLSFFPEYDRTTNWDDRKDSITLHHTLSMSIGLDLSDGNYELGSYGNVESYGEHWIADVLSKPMAFDPGSLLDYSSGAVSLCGPIIRRTSGMTVPAFADRFLFGPLGITSYRWTSFPDGHVCTSGSFWMRTVDFAKFGQLYLQKGRWQGEQLISEEWIAQSTRAVFSAEPDLRLGYGYYWWTEEYYLDDRVINCFYAQGNGGNRLHVFPDANIVIAITSSAYSQDYMFSQVRMMINKFILPGATLPQGTYESNAHVVTVPTAGLLIAAMVLAGAVLLWAIDTVRNRRGKGAALRQDASTATRAARVFMWLCGLVHLGFVLLILSEPTLELHLNTGYKYAVGTPHLAINWALLISAGTLVVLGLTAIVAKWWSTCERLQCWAVTCACVYVLYVVYSWELLILAR